MVKRADNAMVKRTDNAMVKRTNAAQNTNDRSTRTPLKPGVNTCVSEGLVVLAFQLNDANII